MQHTTRGSRSLHVALGATLAVALAATTVHALPDCTAGNPVSRTGRVKRLDVVGLTADGRLVCFTDRAPDKPREIGMVTGLGSADSALIGIDFRVQDGQLYGVGNGGGVYTIDVTTAQATLVSQLTVPLRPAGAYGVDFNPAADRLRIVSDTGQNLRHNVNAGGTTIADGDLNLMAGTTATGISGAAYTNNDLDPSTATTLFDLDAMRDQIEIQSPPNNGSLVATGLLGVDASGPVGFDVFSAPSNGVTVANFAYASLVVDGAPGFYRVDLLTGRADPVRRFTLPIVDITLPIAVQP